MLVTAEFTLMQEDLLRLEGGLVGEWGRGSRLASLLVL